MGRDLFHLSGVSHSELFRNNKTYYWNYFLWFLLKLQYFSAKILHKDFATIFIVHFPNFKPIAKIVLPKVV